MIDLSLALAPWLVAVGGAAGAAGLAGARYSPERGGGVARVAATALGWASLGLSAAAWGSRLGSTGHLPLFGTYESAWSLALAILLAAALVARRSASPAVWGIAAAVAAALVAHGARFDPTAYPLTISERSWIVDVHAVFAWAAFAAFTIGLGLALRTLFASPADRGLVLDGALGLALCVAFVLHTAMLASGSFYKFLLFGSAWSFDPIESLGFVAWVAYGTLLHLHLLAGWDGRRLARWSLGLFVLLAVSYRGIVYFPSSSTYHVFDMNLRVHVAE